MPSQPGKPSPASVEKLVLGFLVSLVLKGALDTAYGKIATAEESAAFLTAVWNPASINLLAFILTLIRFVIGAYRTYESAENLERLKRPGVVLWNFSSSVFLFILFYITALSISSPRYFFLTLLSVHAWDLVWFAVAGIFFPSHDSRLERAVKIFVLMDVLTIAGLAWLALDTGRQTWVQSVSGLVLLATMAVFDFFFNWHFFFPPSTISGEAAAPAPTGERS